MEIAGVETDTPTLLAIGDDIAAWVSAATPPDHEVRSVVDAVEASAAVESAEADVVFCCCRPAEVRPVRDAAPQVPIVAAPDSDCEADPVELTAAGADRYLPRTSEHADRLPGIVADLLGRYDTVREWRRESSILHSLLASAPQSVYVKDEEARLVAASTSKGSEFDGSLLGRTDFELYADRIGEEAAREAHEDDLSVIETGDPVRGKLESHTIEGGQTLWFRTDKFPWRWDDEVVGVLGQTRDVTAHKERELELEEQTRRLEQFASYASHDLRNPLTVASGHLEHAAETGDDASIGKARDALARMEQLVDDLLDLVATDAGEREATWTNLVDVTQRAWSAVDAPDATLDIALPQDLEIRAAPGSLRQVLENLLDNAVTHGGDHVTIGTTDSGFYVADDGPGIPAEERQHIFEHGYTTGGTGVGLSLTADIAETHDWEFRACESESGGARVEMNHCLRQRSDAAPPTERAAVRLESTGTVGDMSLTPSFECDGDGATIHAGGRAVWGDVEDYAAMYATLDGDARVEARLADLEAVHEYSKAGVFAAGEVEPGAPLGFVGSTAEHGHEAAWRTDHDALIETRQVGDGGVVPHWYRIDRVDDRIDCYGSTDGEAWTLLDQRRVPLPDTVRVGLLANSHERDRPCEAAFSDVRAVELERE